MKAIGFNRFGGPEVLEELELEDPILEEGYALVRLSATSVNQLDCVVRRGYKGMLNIKLPHVPGSDVVGTVSAISCTDSPEFAVGDRVVANTLLGCGRCDMCTSGNEMLCRSWSIIGRNIWGSYGSIVRLPTSILIKAPDSFTDAELACMPLSLSTAWRALKTLSGLSEGDTVAIRATSGNVEIFAALLSKDMGINIIGFSRGKRRAKELERIGVKFVVDQEMQPEDITKEVMDYTNGRGVDAVLESVGMTLPGSMDIVRPGGRIIVYGILGGIEATINIMKTYLKSVSIIGTHVSTKREFEEVLAFMSSKNIKPIIGKRLPLSRAAEANALFESSKVFGKLVLENDLIP